jgi:hypothetical protein
VSIGRASLPAGTLTELADLRNALPGFDVIVTNCGGQYRYEAIRRHANGPGPWCVISIDSADLWRELAASTQRGAGAAGGPVPGPPAGQPGHSHRRR